MNQHVDALGGGIVKSISQAAMADLGTPGFRFLPIMPVPAPARQPAATATAAPPLPTIARTSGVGPGSMVGTAGTLGPRTATAAPALPAPTPFLPDPGARLTTSIPEPLQPLKSALPASADYQHARARQTTGEPRRTTHWVATKAAGSTRDSAICMPFSA